MCGEAGGLPLRSEIPALAFILSSACDILSAGDEAVERGKVLALLQSSHWPSLGVGGRQGRFLEEKLEDRGSDLELAGWEGSRPVRTCAGPGQ